MNHSAVSRKPGFSFIHVTMFALSLFLLSLSGLTQAAPSAYVETVQKVYIAYYGRPADPAGLDYWTIRLDSEGGDLSAIIEAFSASPESTALYGDSSSTEKVNAIYQQLFGRDAEAEGLAYYVNGLDAGTFTHATIMMNILDGSVDDDLTTVENKLAVAVEFTDSLDTDAEIAAFDASLTEIREWLSEVAQDTNIDTLDIDLATILDIGMGTETGDILTANRFSGLVSSDTVNCTLSNGSSTTCHQLVFNANTIHDLHGDGELVDDQSGPFCPSGYTAIDGGVGIYDGTTNPGFQNLTQTLWDSMTTDGYDIVDEVAGTICIQDPGSNTMTGNNCTAACLDAAADDSLTVTYLIPVTPEDTDTPTDIGSVEPVGLSLDGIPFTGIPPSVVSGPPGIGGGTPAGGKIPALDHCGGHHDPAGYYHWHLIPGAADQVHAANGTDNQANCSAKMTQNRTALTGFAKDGYPVYSYQDLVGGATATPTDLDECNGHISVTEEFPDGIYHYHASLNAPNMPPCVKGAFVERQNSPSIQ